MGSLDLKTGNMVWEERLKGPGASGDSWSSMLLADGKIYVPNKSVDVFILRAGPKFEVLAANSNLPMLPSPRLTVNSFSALTRRFGAWRIRNNYPTLVNRSCLQVQRAKFN
jgi:hypothetical protein